MKAFSTRFLAVATAATLGLGMSSSASYAADSDGNASRVGDHAAGVRGNGGSGPWSSAERRRDAAKLAASLDRSDAALVASDHSGDASYYLANTQVSQATYYWCGPAAVRSVLKQWGKDVSQSTLASQLGTTTNGTNWGNVGPVLNNRVGSSYYVYYPISYSATSTQIAGYKTRLKSSIGLHQHQFIGGAWEVVNGPHLNGHPNKEIQHYVSIRGFSNYGETTNYQDSASGASSISWSSGVPAVSSIDSTKIARIFGGYGIIW